MFYCDRCGACCRNLRKSKLYAELDRGDGTCRYLAGNLCSIYENRPLLCRPLTEFNLPILFLGSRQDEMCREDLEQEYREMASLIPNQAAAVHLFERGGHPAVMTHAEEAAAVICGFLSQI